jgi:ankyrin repeat protein
MTDNPVHRLTAADVLRRYKDEDQPEFLGIPLDKVDQVGGFGNYPIHLAAVRGDIDELRALIEGGADVNVAGEQGDTPLHDAVMQQHLEAVRLLVEKGGLPTIKNESGKTPLDIAKMDGRDDIADLLR